MLTPATMNQMRHDFALLLNGLDGNDCIIAWSNPDTSAVIDPVYGEVSGTAVTGSQSIRCHVNKIFGEGEIMHKGLIDVIAGDAIILFDKTVDFTGKGNLVFNIQNFGQWEIVQQPPQSFQSYTRLLVSGELFVQAVYMRRLATK